MELHQHELLAANVDQLHLLRLILPFHIEHVLHLSDYVLGARHTGYVVGCWALLTPDPNVSFLILWGISDSL